MMDWSKSKSAFRAEQRNLFTFLSICLLFSCTPEQPKIVKNHSVGGALGTSYSLIYLADRELDYQQEIDSVFSAINNSMSTYIPDSDISKINRGDSTVVVDKMFQEVFRLSKEIHEKTNGYFDPTVGTLVNAWGFGPGRQMTLDSMRVDSLMRYVGFEKVSLTQKQTIRKEDTNIHFDFNAIAKGYAIDQLAVLMNQKGIQNYLLEVGGEVVAKGENMANQRPWGIAVQDPQTEGAKISIQLKDKAMASSGNYRKFRVDSISGKKYVHTVDPKTGFTKNANTLGVNILANTCAEADAYATAFMAMDLVDTIKFLTNQRVLDAYIIYLDDKGETQDFMTKGFREMVLD